MDAEKNSSSEESGPLRDEASLILDRLSRFSLLQAELADARHNLDLVTRRFRRMQDFMSRAVRTESPAALAALTCEAVVDILDCELGILWCLRCSPGWNSLYFSPGPRPFIPSIDELAAWAGRWASDHGSNKNHPLPTSLDFHDYLVAPILDDDGVAIGILIAANTNARSHIHGRFDESSERSFATFAGQVGAIMESRRRRDMINGQIETIRLSEERLSLALQGSNVGLWDWDFRENRVYYSEQWKNQLGYSGEEISDSISEWSDRLHPDDRISALSKGYEFFQSGDHIYSSQFRLRHRNGEWRWMEAKGYVIRDTDDKPRRAVGIHIDITAFKELEDRLRSSKEQAERANQAKSSFLANISHEIRTPLNGIIGTLQLLRNTEINEAQRKLVELGETAGRWIMDIIGESLDLARIEAGKFPLKVAPFELRTLVSDVIEIKRPKASAKGLRLRCVVTRDLPKTVVGDQVRIRQVLANLVGNAIKFTEHGSVTVGLRRMRRKNKDDSPVLEIVVADTGIGIPLDLAETVFQPFQQIQPTDRSLNGGIGLGLAISREIVSLMHGHLGVTRRRRRGSRFVVTLPLQEAPATPALQPGKISRTHFHGRVLIVEDDPISREVATLMIQRRGLSVDTAADGGEGLRLLLTGRYDLAFVDCWMPVLDGLELARRFREQASVDRRNIPIIALTANTLPDHVEASRLAGMNHYLTKPLMDDALLDCLNRFAPHQPPPAGHQSPDSAYCYQAATREQHPPLSPHPTPGK